MKPGRLINDCGPFQPFQTFHRFAPFQSFAGLNNMGKLHVFENSRNVETLSESYR